MANNISEISIRVIPTYGARHRLPLIMYIVLNHAITSRAFEPQDIVKPNLKHASRSLMNNQHYFRVYMHILAPQGLQLWQSLS